MMGTRIQRAKRRGGAGTIVLIVVGCVIGGLAVVSLLISILMPGLGRARELARRAACMTNLNGMGKALTVYQGDNDDAWPYLDGANGWERVATGTNQTVEPGSTVEHCGSAIPFLLVRSGQPARMFVCPSDETAQPDLAIQTNGEYDWDFSNHANISYSWQAPVRDVATGRWQAGLPVNPSFSDPRSSAVIAADKTPAYDGGDPGRVDWAKWRGPRSDDEKDFDRTHGMSQNHKGPRVGGGEQIHFLRASISVDRSEQADVGIGDDNIYTTGGPSPRGVMGIENHTDPNDTYLIGPVR